MRVYQFHHFGTFRGSWLIYAPGAVCKEFFQKNEGGVVVSAWGRVPDAGYEKGFLGPSVEAFGFLVCKKGRSCFSYSNRRARLFVVANFFRKSCVSGWLCVGPVWDVGSWRASDSTKN